MDLTKLMADAARAAREKYAILPFYEMYELVPKGIPAPEYRGSKESCEAHLDHLVAEAVIRALREGGWAIVPREPTQATKLVRMFNESDPTWMPKGETP